MEQSHGRFVTVGVVISGIAWTTWLALSSEAPGVVQWNHAKRKWGSDFPSRLRLECSCLARSSVLLLHEDSSIQFNLHLHAPARNLPWYFYVNTTATTSCPFPIYQWWTFHPKDGWFIGTVEHWGWAAGTFLPKRPEDSGKERNCLWMIRDTETDCYSILYSVIYTVIYLFMYVYIYIYVHTSYIYRLYWYFF